jgi:lipoprotein-anchoring transpeptidase ErfK/SrfK
MSELRPAVIPEVAPLRPSGLRGRSVAVAVFCAGLGLLASACGGSTVTASQGRSGQRGGVAGGVRLSITPVAGGTDTAPDQGITVRAVGGRISNVTVRTGGDPVTGTLNSTGTLWRSTRGLDVSRGYAVTATAAGASGPPVTRSVSFRTLTPQSTFSAEIIEGSGQTYGVGMPIILLLSQPIVNKAAVERALEVRTSKPVVGAWYWDSQCRLAPECLYFRPRSYWPAHTQVSFTGHLNGVEAAAGVYGDHTLTQTFTIGSPLTVVASTASHYLNVYRDGKLFAHWPISTGRPGDETPNGTYLTIEKANPVDMIGPGYNIEVPWSVRITFSGDYLHDAYWSVGEQGSENVSHGCVNMSPEDAEIFYKMAVPGDPVKITGSPRAGAWDNGWTVWFLPWKQWVAGSALHEAVLAGPHGSAPVSPSTSQPPPTPRRHPPRRLGQWEGPIRPYFS